MIYMDINQADINEMFDFFEATERKKKTDKESFETIKSIIAKENKKRGKKSASFQLIKKLQEKEMSEIAIYTAMALAQLNIKPKWTIEEVMGALEDKNFIDDELIPYLVKNDVIDEEMSDEEKITIAKQIQENILQNEKNTIEYVKNVITSQSKIKNSIFVHQLSASQLENIKNAIKEALTIFQSATSDFNMDSYLNYDAENSSEQTYQFFTKLLGGEAKASCESLPLEISAVLAELNEVQKSKQIKSAQGRKKLAGWISSLESANKVFNAVSQKRIIWPESDSDIKNLDELEAYFVSLEEIRDKMMPVIRQYKKRTQTVTHIKSTDEEENKEIVQAEWDEEKVNNLVNSLVKNLLRNKEIRSIDYNDLIKKTDELAEKMFKKFDGLEEYLSIDHPDAIGELSGRIAARMGSSKALLGRPKKENISIV